MSKGCTKTKTKTNEQAYLKTAYKHHWGGRVAALGRVEAVPRGPCVLKFRAQMLKC